MYQDVVRTLTKEQIDQLEQMGVARSTVSNWKHGKRLPTLPQAKTLALVAMVSFSELVDELAEMEATPEQRTFFRSAMARGLNVFLAALFCILQGLFAQDAQAAEQGLARVSSASAAQSWQRQVAHCRAFRCGPRNRSVSLR